MGTTTTVSSIDDTGSYVFESGNNPQQGLTTDNSLIVTGDITIASTAYFSVDYATNGDGSSTVSAFGVVNNYVLEIGNYSQSAATTFDIGAGGLADGSSSFINLYNNSTTGGQSTPVPAPLLLAEPVRPSHTMLWTHAQPALVRGAAAARTAGPFLVRPNHSTASPPGRL